jgi:hypothetical protein
MHWKRSRNGRRYLYRCVRQGDRVVTKYVGTGQVAALAQRREALERARQAAERRVWLRLERRHDRIDAKMRELCTLTEQLMMIELILAGYHRHEWEWRKRRARKRTTKAA